ncbi:MAG: hypothetical protein IJY21_04690 [Clostridia bacterium]|nr:hypothetical protein [Clostridia bacterium]
MKKNWKRMLALSAAARDEVSGVCEVSVSAWYNYASTSPVMLDIKNGRFETKKAGTYAIVYEAKDYCGNVAKEILWVRAEKELPALTAALDNAGATETKLGELTAAHGVTVSGASGNYTVDYSSGSLVRKLCDVEITDENGVKTYKSGDKFIPSVANNGDEVSFVYLCGNEKTAAIKVPTVKVWTNHSIFGKVLEPQNYLYGENILTQTGDKNTTARRNTKGKTFLRSCARTRTARSRAKSARPNAAGLTCAPRAKNPKRFSARS